MKPLSILITYYFTLIFLSKWMPLSVFATPSSNCPYNNMPITIYLIFNNCVTPSPYQREGVKLNFPPLFIYFTPAVVNNEHSLYFVNFEFLESPLAHILVVTSGDYWLSFKYISGGKLFHSTLQFSQSLMVRWWENVTSCDHTECFLMEV